MHLVALLLIPLLTDQLIWVPNSNSLPETASMIAHSMELGVSFMLEILTHQNPNVVMLMELLPQL